MKLCAFPNDPLKSYHLKGEIKDRYFNPKNFFSEIHVISFVENDIEESKVKAIAGNAKLQIHSVGKIGLREREKHVEKIVSLVQKINPNVIRAYSPRLEGWYAATCSEKLKIPFFLSLHTQHDYNRKLAKKSNIKKFLALKYTERFIEPYVLKRASKITIVFKIIEPYVTRLGGKKPELLYNKVDYDRFSNSTPIESLPKPLVLSVGNLIKEKNHECIIIAMKKLDGYCLIIGKGGRRNKLINLIKKENLEDKIIIKEFVPHNEIQNYYKSAQIFALAYDPELEGLPMPVMEAMATGLPVVIPSPKEGYSEGLEDIAIFSKRDSNSFSKNIKKILDDPILQKKYSEKSQTKARDFDAIKIEKREAEIYKDLITKQNVKD
jgi:glycosyltransferase involved in cell wall biosynthesis